MHDREEIVGGVSMHLDDPEETLARLPERLPFYGPSALPIDYEKDLGDPGEFPHTRGTRAPRARRPDQGHDFIVRELSGEGSPRRSNEQFHYLLEHGATGLDVIGDTPTQCFLDPDHPFARHAVGNQGVSVCRGADYVELYEGIPLDRVSCDHSLPGGFATAGFFLAAERHGFDAGALRGSAILPPLYAEDTAYSSNLPVELHMRLATDSIEFAAEHMPRYHPFIEDTYYISDGSVDIVDEMALGFVELREVVRRLLDRGLKVDAFAPRIALLVNCRMDFFAEVAKIRASRRLYARMMREEFGARDPRSLAINVAAHTSGATMTAQQLGNNIARGAIQATALYMAGVRAMEISAFDEALRTPSKDAHVVALGTQHVVQLESGVADVADPLGGSWYVERLTTEIEDRIRARIAQIEADGDVVELAQGGYFRGIFEEAMVANDVALRGGGRPIVGVSVNRIPESQDTLLREVAEERIEPDYERIAAIAAWRGARDGAAVTAALDRLENRCRDGANVMPGLLEALRAEASMGECIGVLRECYGRPYDPLGGTERPR
jgi:methylmalonyl-CoA mutase N-terminal domain/subunit